MSDPENNNGNKFDYLAWALEGARVLLKYALIAVGVIVLFCVALWGLLLGVCYIVIH